jgi:periplasmic divalent cation tolerance protein
MAKIQEFLIVMCTFPELDRAREIADEIVACRLAACAQIIPGVYSIFHWENKLDHAEEHLLLLKTVSGHYQALEEKIISLHPYELPEIIAVSLAAGLDNYLNWIENNTVIK